MEENRAIQFNMIKIDVKQFAILSETAPADEDIQLQSIVNFKADVEQRVVACNADFSFSCNKALLIKLKVECVFIVKSNDWESLKNDKNCVVLPKGFLCHMALHTVGTARGILHCKTESTPFGYIILPPINVEEMIGSDLVIS